MYLVTEGTLLLYYKRDRGASEAWLMLCTFSMHVDFSDSLWVPKYILLLRFKDAFFEANGRRADVLRDHGWKPCHLVMCLVTFPLLELHQLRAISVCSHFSSVFCSMKGIKSCNFGLTSHKSPSPESISAPLIES